MYQPFTVGDVVVVWIIIDQHFRIPVIATIAYAHPEYGWCSCDVGPFKTSYWNNDITPLAEWDSSKPPIYLNDFNYGHYIFQQKQSALGLDGSKS